MDSLVDFALRQKYAKVKKLRSRLDEMNRLFDWDAFICVFPRKENCVGRPNYDKILMVKCLLLQGWYSLSDEELEYQLYNRLDFQQFLGFPKSFFVKLRDECCFSTS